MKVASLALTIAFSASSTVSLGQDSTAPKSTTEHASINLTGDTLQLNSSVSGFAPSSSTPSTGTVVAPKGSCFRVSHEVSKKLDEMDAEGERKSEKYVRGVFRTGWRILYSCKGGRELGSVDANQSYDIKRETLLDSDTTRFGWTYGILVAPFKFYTSSRDFSAGASVGPYLGYRLYDRPGNSAVLAGAVGATNATVKTNNPDGTESTTQKNGMTFALAYLLNIKSDFNVGLIGGWDVFSKSDSIPNSGKLWLSLSFGRKID